MGTIKDNNAYTAQPYKTRNERDSKAHEPPRGDLEVLDGVVCVLAIVIVLVGAAAVLPSVIAIGGRRSSRHRAATSRSDERGGEARRSNGTASAAR